MDSPHANDVPSQTPVPTPDGRPTPLAELNTETPLSATTSQQGLLKRIAELHRKLNLVLAGMYTGVGCSGTPHSHHTYNKKNK